MALLALLPVLGTTLLFVRATPDRPALAPFAAVASITALLYLGGLAGWLRPIAAVVFWGGILLLPTDLFLLRRARIPLARAADPAIVLFFLFALGYWSVFSQAEFFFWDEFSHWGLAVKLMTHTDRLVDAGGVLQFPHYPPATAVFQYFATRNVGYSEAAALFAQFLLVLAPTMILYAGASWRRPLSLVVAVALQIFLIVNLGHGAANLYVDHVVAVFFGAIVVACLADRWATRTLLLLAPALFCLVLVKEVGAYFAAAATLWIVVDRLVAARPWRHPGGNREWLRSAAVVAVVSLPLAAHLTWKGKLERHGIVAPASGDVGVSEAVSALFGAPDGYRATVRRRYGEVLFGQQVSASAISQDFNEFSYAIRDRYPTGFRFSAVGFAILATALILLRALVAARERDVLYRLAGFVALVFVVYATLLYLLYALVFPEEKAVNVASYVRYIDIVVLPVVMIGFAPWLALGARFGWRARREQLGIWLPAATLAFLYLFETPYLALIVEARPRVGVRARVQDRLRDVRELVPRDASLYVIPTVRDNGFLQTLLRYELAPQKVAFGAPATTDELQRALRGYEYLYVFAFNRTGVAQLGGPFASGAALYRIDDVRGTLRLMPLH